MATASAASAREQQREETRERIFEAAVEEFRREGFARARVDRVVAAAGVARGTFYFHFPTKEHVLLELQKRHEAALHARLEAMPRPRSARQLLRQIADALLEETERRIDRHLFREILALHIRRYPEKLHAAEDDAPRQNASQNALTYELQPTFGHSNTSSTWEPRCALQWWWGCW